MRLEIRDSYGAGAMFENWTTTTLRKTGTIRYLFSVQAQAGNRTNDPTGFLVVLYDERNKHVKKIITRADASGHTRPTSLKSFSVDLAALVGHAVDDPSEYSGAYTIRLFAMKGDVYKVTGDAEGSVNTMNGSYATGSIPLNFSDNATVDSYQTLSVYQWLDGYNTMFFGLDVYAGDGDTVEPGSSVRTRLRYEAFSYNALPSTTKYLDLARGYLFYAMPDAGFNYAASKTTKTITFNPGTASSQVMTEVVMPTQPGTYSLQLMILDSTSELDDDKFSAHSVSLIIEEPEPEPEPEVKVFTISKQPEDFEGEIGDTITVSLEVDGVEEGDTRPFFFWQVKKPESVNFAICNEMANYSLAVTTFELTRELMLSEFRCMIYYNGATYYSNVIKYIGEVPPDEDTPVEPDPEFDVIEGSESFTGKVGDLVHLYFRTTEVSDPENITYIWYFKMSEGDKWSVFRDTDNYRSPDLYFVLKRDYMLGRFLGVATYKGTSYTLHSVGIPFVGEIPPEEEPEPEPEPPKEPEPSLGTYDRVFRFRNGDRVPADKLNSYKDGLSYIVKKYNFDVNLLEGAPIARVGLKLTHTWLNWYYGKVAYLVEAVQSIRRDDSGLLDLGDYAPREYTEDVQILTPEDLNGLADAINYMIDMYAAEEVGS